MCAMARPPAAAPTRCWAATALPGPWAAATSKARTWCRCTPRARRPQARAGMWPATWCSVLAGCRQRCNCFAMTAAARSGTTQRRPSWPPAPGARAWPASGRSPARSNCPRRWRRPHRPCTRGWPPAAPSRPYTHPLSPPVPPPPPQRRGARPMFLMPSCCASDGKRAKLHAKAFVDYQNDVTAADIGLAVRENYHSIEHVKRYTALGFGTDQGKLSNVNGVVLIARALQRPVGEVGTTTYRPAYTPVSLGALAGTMVQDCFDPSRYTALHEAHVARGAALEPVGQWLRPWYFARAGEDLRAAVNRECLAA